MLSYYPCERKTLRWYKKIFVHTLMILVVNGYHLHNMYTVGQKVSLYDFRLRVLERLLTQPAIAPVPTPPRNAPHRIAKVGGQNARGDSNRKRCRQCFKEGRKNKKTLYCCEVCPDKPGLCPGKCFDVYHLNKTT